MRSTIVAAAGALLVLAGCSSNEAASPVADTTPQTTAKAEPEVHALGDTVNVGGVTISDIEIITEGCEFQTPPTRDAVKFQVLATVENGTSDEIAEVLWPTDISFTDPDGMRVKTLDISQGEPGCENDHPRQFNGVIAGEKRRAAVTVEAPAGAQEMIYSTSLIDGATPVRWDVADEVASMDVAPPEPAESDAPAEPSTSTIPTEPVPAAPPTSAAPAAPAAPAAEGTPPVVGMTEAPGHGTPQPMDKTISHCGDPMLHQTGTTFFTDGTSGWTQNCASQMGY